MAGLTRPDLQVDPVAVLDAYAAECWDEARAHPNELNRYYDGKP